MTVPTHDITGEPVAAGHERKQRHPLLVWAWSLVHLDFVGIAFGALFFCLSLTPSLLPRDWLFQGLIGGLNAAIGYGIGVFARRCCAASCYDADDGGHRPSECSTGARPRPSRWQQRQAC